MNFYHTTVLMMTVWIASVDAIPGFVRMLIATVCFVVALFLQRRALEHEVRRLRELEKLGPLEDDK